MIEDETCRDSNAAADDRHADRAFELIDRVSELFTLGSSESLERAAACLDELMALELKYFIPELEIELCAKIDMALLRCLQDEDREVRNAAVAGFKNRLSGKLLDDVLNLMNSTPRPDVKISCTEVLHYTDSPAALDALLDGLTYTWGGPTFAMSRNEGNVRMHCAYALKGYDISAHEMKLIDHLTAPGQEGVVRAALSEALCGRLSKAGIRKLLSKLPTGDDLADSYAVEALHGARHPDIETFILAGLGESSDFLTRRYIKLAAASGLTRCEGALIDLLAHDKFGGDAATALRENMRPDLTPRIMDSIDETGIIARLKALFVRRSPERSRQIANALDALVDCEDPRALAIARSRITDSAQSVIVSATKLLATRGTTVDLPDLLELSANPESRIASKAVMGLARLRHPEGEARLAEILRSDTGALRHYILRGLGGISDEELVKQVARVVYAAAFWESELAVKALRGNRSASAIDALVAGLNDPEERVRTAAAESLQGCSHNPAVTDKILAAYETLNPITRQACALALKDTTDPRARGTLMGALPDPLGADLLSSHEMDCIAQCVASISQDLALSDPAKFYPGLRSESPDVRHSALMVLALHKDGATVAELTPLLKDNHVRVAAAAAEALSGCKFKSGVAALLEATSDHHFLVRVAALRALATIFH